MRKIAVMAFLFPIFGLMAQSAPTPAGPVDPFAEPPIHRVGAYTPAASDAPVVLDAKTFLQRHLPTMVLGEVTEAYTQVVAGLNVKLVCTVTGEDGPSTWQLVAYRSLDGQWHFHTAKRL